MRRDKSESTTVLRLLRRKLPSRMASIVNHPRFPTVLELRDANGEVLFTLIVDASSPRGIEDTCDRLFREAHARGLEIVGPDAFD